ncbi:MAG: hypothetical protein ABIQ18_32035 [Umezawaea sp.]
MTEFTRPGHVPLFDGGPYSHHVLPDRGDDVHVRTLVDHMFMGGPGALGTHPRLHPRLVRQLLDRAPDPEFLGVEDWAPRALRVDEVAAIYGRTPPTRDAWLLRADEISRAWGRGLLGPGGLVAELLGPDAPGHLPHVSQ